MKLNSIELPPRIPGLSRTLILLHGYGADAQDLIPIAEQLGDSNLVISLQAPIPLGNGGYAWYYLAQTASGLIPGSSSTIVHRLDASSAPAL